MEIKDADSDDLVDEIIRRMDRRKIDFDDLLRLERALREELGESDIPDSGLCDQMKRDWLIENWDDFTVENLEKLLKQNI